MKKHLISFMLLALALPAFAGLERWPKPDEGTRYQSVNPDYLLLGGEASSDNVRIFWVVISTPTVDSRAKLSAIVKDIFTRNKVRYGLDHRRWAAYFYRSESEAGFLISPPEAWLATYDSAVSRTTVYPLHPPLMKWHHGPKFPNQSAQQVGPAEATAGKNSPLPPR